MQLSISEQANQLVEHIDILMLSTQQHLDEKHRVKLQKLSAKMREFVADYHAHVDLSVSEYASYLNHDALSPLTIVLGYAELFSSVNAHVLTFEEINVINMICDKVRFLTDCVRSECDLMVAKRDGHTSI